MDGVFKGVTEEKILMRLGEGEEAVRDFIREKGI